MFSAFYLNPQYGWLATHRLPLDSAIRYCQEYRLNERNCPVAIVPDREDPSPYLALAEQARGWPRSELLAS